MRVYPPVEQLLHHRAPMLLVDEVMSWEPGRSLVARHTVRADEPFVSEGRVPALVALEYMAQTIGLYVGLEAQEAGRPLPLGYLVSCREMSCEVDSFAPGEQLELRVEWVWGETQLGQFLGTTRQEGRLLAQARISVYAGAEGTEMP